MAKSIKLKNNTYWDSKSIVHNQTSLSDTLNGIDYTSKCTFNNSTLTSGKIIKLGRIVVLQLAITSKITNSWGTAFVIPSDLYPLGAYDKGVNVDEFWIYGAGAGNGAGNVKATLTEGETYIITGMYISAN